MIAYSCFFAVNQFFRVSNLNKPPILLVLEPLARAPFQHKFVPPQWYPVVTHISGKNLTNNAGYRLERSWRAATCQWPCRSMPLPHWTRRTRCPPVSWRGWTFSSVFSVPSTRTGIGRSSSTTSMCTSSLCTTLGWIWKGMLCSCSLRTMEITLLTLLMTYRCVTSIIIVIYKKYMFFFLCLILLLHGKMW